MFKYLKQLWKSKQLRNRILFTIAILFLYRAIAHVPIPTADEFALSQFLDNQNSVGFALGIISTLTGGAIESFSIVLLGLSPYINASIIMQLSTVIFPQLEAIQKEGAQGQQKLNRYTRYLTLPLAFIQSYGLLLLLQPAAPGLIDYSFPGVLLPMLFCTAGSLFLVWLGELITEKGIGNGISLLIFASIVTGIPTAISSILAGGSDRYGAFALFCIVTIALLVAIVIFTDAHRLIPITYANQGAGRGVQGSIPIRLLQAGMIPIIFAISLVTFPEIIAQLLQNTSSDVLVQMRLFIERYLSSQNPSYIYILVYFMLVVGFTFFYVSITFKPAEISETIQKRGGFVPGVRPGKPTATLLEKVSNRINLWGGAFLGFVAVVPLFFQKFYGLQSSELIITGSGLIIVVGVVMELIRQTNAQLIAHDYEKLV